MIILVQSQDGSYSIPKNIRFCVLPHPKSSIDMIYAIVDKVIMELQSVQPRRHGSWFIDQRVSSDKDLYLASPVDPRFLILPYLEKQSTRFCPLDQIVVNSVPLEGSLCWKLDEICDVNDKYGDDMILYRFNQDKSLTLMKNKVDRTAILLAAERKKRAAVAMTVLSFQNTAQSSKAGTKTALESSKNETDAEEEDIKTALQIVTEYLTDSLTTKLLNLYKMSSIDINKSNSNSNNNESESLKRKADWEIQLEVEKETLAFSSLSKLPPTASSASSAITAKSNNGKTASNSKVIKPLKGQKSLASFFGAGPVSKK